MNISASNAGRPAPRECIAAVHSAGGRAVLAHPYQLGYADDRLEETLRTLREKGARRFGVLLSPSYPWTDCRLSASCGKNMGSISQRAAISTGKPSVRTPD